MHVLCMDHVTVSVWIKDSVTRAQHFNPGLHDHLDAIDNIVQVCYQNQPTAIIEKAKFIIVSTYLHCF